MGNPLWASLRFNRLLLGQVRSFQPDLLFVIKGCYVQRYLLEEIRSRGRTLLVNYATDNPFNPRGSTDQVVRAIDLYDLYVTPTRALAPRLKAAGARRVLWVPFGYEPSLHFPERPLDGKERMRWAGDVVFAGLCDEDRAPFLTALARLQEFDVRLFGEYWNRVPALRNIGRGLIFGRDYRLAQGSSRIALNFIRRANWDGHTMRTFEIPACGGFLLTQRTSEQLEFFEEGKEMACFSSPEEMVEKVRYYLSHEEERQRIAQAGHQKVTNGGHTYRDRLTRILQAAEDA